jgi:hypothetical protein
MNNKILLEYWVYKFVQIVSPIAILCVLSIRLFHIKNILLVKTGFIIFAFDLFILGLWTLLGTIYRWKTFKRAYKRIDLERYFGGIGSIIYVILGVFICFFAIFSIIYLLNNDLNYIKK